MIDVYYVCYECGEYKLTRKEKGMKLYDVSGHHFAYVLDDISEEIRNPICERCGSIMVRK